MKIKKRLILNTWIYLFFAMLMILSLVWSYREFYRTSQNVNLAWEMQKTAFERVSLWDDYLLHRENRAIIQWKIKSESLRRLIETATERFTGKEEKKLLQEARYDFDKTFSGFSAILERDKRERRRASRAFYFDEMEKRLTGQVFLKSYSLVDSLGRLYESALRTRTRTQNIGIFLIAFFFGSSGIAIVINSIFLNSTIMKRLNALNDGVGIIGGGNLDYHIAEEGNDELTDLSRASNEMVAKLKQSYTSMENFQKEISERNKAEENIKKLSLHQQALLSSIPDIIMEVDENKVYTWANERGIDFFGKDVIGKEADFYFIREQKTYEMVQPIFNGSDDVIYVESWQRRKDGQERLLAWRCRALKDVKGNVIGALSSAHDITELRQIEDELKKINKELDQRVRERTAELSAKTIELERINNVFVDREVRMRELKARIKELEKTYLVKREV